MKPRSAIAKGKILEEWISERLMNSGLDDRAHRQKGSGSGEAKCDVANNLNLCIEAKNTKNFLANEFWKQVKGDCLMQIPVVCWHRNNVPLEETKVMIEWGFFEQLLIAWKAANERTPNWQPEGTVIPKWKLTKLKEDINSILRDL
jgi:hypothetical protein